MEGAFSFPFILLYVTSYTSSEPHTECWLSSGTENTLNIVSKLFMNRGGFLPAASSSWGEGGVSPILYVSLGGAGVKAVTASCAHSFWILYLGYRGLEYLAFCSFPVFAFKAQVPLIFSGRWEFLCVIRVPNVPNWTPGKWNMGTFRMLA